LKDGSNNLLSEFCPSDTRVHMVNERER